MKWYNVSESSRYGVAIYNFSHENPYMLKLNVGDSVLLLKESDEWYYGSYARNRSKSGVFPRSFVCVRDAIVDRSGLNEIFLPHEPPIVQEISSVLREWWIIWKQLYVLNSTHFESVRNMMYELVDWRKSIMSGTLPADELKEVKQKVTAKIDVGNHILGLDLVVRDEHGNILNPEMTSTVDLYRAHKIAATQIETMNNIDYRSQKSLSRYCHNLFVTVKNFVCRVGDDADLLMTLYDAKEGVFISENYLVKWGKGGLAKDMDQLNNLRVLFTDLGSKDLNREKVFLVCQIIRIGSMELKEGEHKKSNVDRKSSMGGGKRLGEGVRRPFGVAAMDISDIITGKLESDEEKQYFVPFVQCGDHDFLDSVIRKILTAKEVSQKDHKGQGLWCCLKLLHGDIKQVREENPHLVSTSTSVARKMGFPEVILPGDVRNDLYLTLAQGEFPRGTISMERNIEVTVKVCNEKGQVIPGVISYGSGCDPMKEYRSMIYYHEDKPKWMETFKVAIPIEEFYNSHLKFTFRHRSSNEAKDKAEKVFALSFVKLMQKNGTTLKDESHDLLVFKVDHKKYDDTDTSYLNLPSTRSDLESYALNTKLSSNGLSFSSKDSFSISTLVCSTKLTQNVDLLGLLKWWANPENLESNLKALMKVDGEEVVKFLQDTLDALFDILMKNPDSELYDNLVVDALVFIIGLISDRKYHHFRPVLDVYIMENFCATLAYTKLMVVLKYYVDNANDPDEAFHDKLLKTMKSIEYLFKFIVRSRQLFSEINSGKGKQQFENSLQRLLESLSSMMLYDSDLTLVIQGACLKFLPFAIPDILTVFDGTLLCNILVEMITNVPADRLTKQKMTCVNDIVHSALFQLPECRAILMPLVNFQLKQLLERNEEMELCVKILSDMLTVLHHQNSSATKDDFTEINNSILRTVIQTVITMSRDRSLVGNMVAIMIDIFRKMTPYHYNQYVSSFPLPSDLLDFLMEILLVFRDLVSKNVYQKDWSEMIMLQNSVVLKSLRYFSHTIRDHFTNPFEYQVWNNFFHCAISFLTQDPLQLENFSQNKRNKIIARYKDMRRETGFEIRSLWFNLGQNKIKFVPEMVGPFLEMTLIPEIELRKATIPIFFDMMQCEFYSPRHHGVSLYEEFFAQNHDIKGSFKEFEDEMITQLDMLVEGGRGDEQYKELFLEILSSLCENHATMNDQGMRFVQTAVRLMRRLLEYRVIVMDENKESRMSCTVNLLEFYNEINRKEMYIRYLYKLCDLHLECDNFVEAAYSLLLHTRLLHWSDEPVPQPLKNDKYPHCETQRDLKEKLYYDIIDYFDKGKLWETGLTLCKELAIQLENEVFDYIQLGDLLKRMATFYDNIMSKVRPEPEYFRVGYFGQGFPTFLSNKVFVYRGKEYERLNDFQGRLLNQFPKAQLLTKLSPPSQEITESTGQFLQINKVDPVMKENEKFKSKTVHDQILKYYRVNEVQNFVYSRPIRKGEKDNDNEFATMWIERTSLETRYPLPGILRWFNVNSVKVTELSPLENAIEAMEVSNLKIKESIIQHRADPALPSNPLCMLLSGIVDAAVMGGIVNYEKAFFNEDYLKLNNSPKDIEGVEKLKDLIASQIPLLEAAIAIHRTKAHPSLKPLQEHLEQSFAKLKKNVEEKYGEKKAPKEILERHHVSIRRVKPSQNVNHTSAPIPPERVSSTTLSIVDLTRRTASLTGGSISPTKLTQSVRAQSVWVKPTTSVPFKSNGTKKRDSGTLRRSSASTTSQSSTSNHQLQHQISESSTLWYDTPSKPESPRIELSEELTPARPRRSEVEKRYSRPSSEHFRRRSTPSPTRHSRTPSNVSLSNPSTPCTEDDNDDKPPPLPQKQAYADYSNITDEMQLSGFANRKSSLSLPTRIKNRPPPPLPVRDNSPLSSPTQRRHLPIPTSDVNEIPPEIPKKPHRMLLDSQSQGS